MTGHILPGIARASSLRRRPRIGWHHALRAQGTRAAPGTSRRGGALHEPPHVAPQVAARVERDGGERVCILENEILASPTLPGLLLALRHPRPEVRAYAARSLGDLGPEREEALPDLAAALRDPDWGVSDAAATTLVAIGERAVPAFLEALEAAGGPSLPVLMGLRRLGRLAGAAAPALAAIVRDRAVDRPLRVEAALTLALVDPKGRDAVPVLVEVLRDADVKMAASATRALALLGPAARPALPALLAALAHGAVEVRCSAAFALGRAAGGDQHGLAALVAPVLRHETAAVREAAARALDWIGTAPASSVPDLARMLGETPVLSRRPAARVLGKLGPAACEAIPALERALADEALFHEAAEALEKVRGLDRMPAGPRGGDAAGAETHSNPPRGDSP